MSYIVPSPQIYQQLANAGGVANTTPDLDAVIIGPCYNVVDYDSTSSATLTLSAAVDLNGNAVSVTNNQVNTVCYLPSQKVGQALDESSLAVYFNNALVETAAAGFTGTSGNNQLAITTATSPCVVTVDSATLSSVTNASQFVVGDNVTVAGAGVAGADLVANVITVSSSSLVIDQVASTASSSSTVTKNPLNNLNTTSSTLKIEGGDTAYIVYKTSGGTTKTFSTTVSEVVATNNIVGEVIVSDILPSDVVNGLVEVHFRKVYNNQLVPSSEYESDTTAVDAKITILPTPHIVYGLVITAEIHAAYRALRTDLSGAIQTITTTGDLTGILGNPSERNPLALGVQLAKANTTTQVLAVAVPSDDLLGYQTALELIEDARVYSLVPLTQEIDILTTFQQHVDQLSTPKNAHWRIALVNTAIPSVKDIGPFNKNLVNANGGNSAITNVNGRYILTVSNASFMSDGVVPGDIVVITAGTGTPSPVGNHQVKTVISNQQLEIVATGTATGVSYYVTRNLTKAQQAAYVAGISTTFGDKRVIHCPNVAGVTINGATKYLPGYYFMCGIAGLVAGLPAQAGLTNIALAGFADVQMSNYYFTRAQMNTMAAAGTLLMAQESQGSIPYVRHEITTDMTVLEYREIQQVKNWDYLSYFFYDVVKGFIGKWNITADSLNTLRQTITAGGVLLQGKKVAKYGPPLVSFKINSLTQDANNKDNVNVVMPIAMADPMNYINLYLVV